MQRRLLLLAAVVAALVVAAPAASAQLPIPPGGTDPNQPPPAAEAKMSLALTGGLVDRKVRYFLKGDHLSVHGSIKPYVEDQTVDVRLFRKGKFVGHRTVKVKKGKGSTGIFKATLSIKQSGKYSVHAHHEGNVKQRSGDSAPHRFTAIKPGAHRGSKGETVRLLQIGLRRLAYVAPLTGRFEDGTARAVLAFRKVNRMSHDYTASTKVFRKLFRGSGTFHLRHKKGRHAEADLSRQVLVLADHGKAQMIFSVSSGKPSTPTIQGTFRFYRKEPGTNSHGMVDSTYFSGGYAVHGYASVPPNYPASHGCIRVPIPDARRIYDSLSLGETIYVYH